MHFVFPLAFIDGYDYTFLESFTAIKLAQLLHILANKVGVYLEQQFKKNEKAVLKREHCQ